MKFYISILIASCVATLDAKREFRCDYTYIEETDSFLKFHEIPSNWQEARIRCNMEGSRLASPLNGKWRGAIGKMMEEKKLAGPIFTGIHATFSKGDYFSLEGIPLAGMAHSWAKNEPDNCNNEEDCIVLLPDGTMADAPCNETYPYMCYTDAKGKVINACGTTDPEYTYDHSTGSCYKFHNEFATWPVAFRTCAAEGGYLAIINSETEATVLQRIFEKYPESSLTGNFEKNYALMGFYALTHNGKWVTIHDETIKEAGYDKFAPNEPNNDLQGEFCGSITRKAMLNDIPCSGYKFLFICEKDPDSLLCKDH